jgi:hypothetical protein
LNTNAIAFDAPDNDKSTTELFTETALSPNMQIVTKNICNFKKKNWALQLGWTERKPTLNVQVWPGKQGPCRHSSGKP